MHNELENKDALCTTVPAVNGVCAGCRCAYIVAAFYMHLYCFMQIWRNASVGARPICFEHPLLVMCLFASVLIAQQINAF
jgi:hypothetical protein